MRGTAADHPFADESRTLLASLANGRGHIAFSRPAPDDVEGRDFDSAGRLSATLLASLELPRDADAYLCGPAAFMGETGAALAGLGLDPGRIHVELFGPAPGQTPGIASAPSRPPHVPAGTPGRGPTIEFSRSNLAVAWSRNTPACSSSPRRATYRFAGHVAPASATAARPPSSPARSSTAPIPSRLPPTAPSLICCAQPSDHLILDL